MSFTYLQYNVFIISIQDMHHNVSILIWETHWDGHGINSGQRPVVHTDIGNALNLTDTLYGYCIAAQCTVAESTGTTNAEEFSYCAGS